MATFQVNLIADANTMLFKNGWLLAHKIHYTIDKADIYEGSTITITSPLAEGDILQMSSYGTMYLFKMENGILKDRSDDVVEDG